MCPDILTLIEIPFASAPLPSFQLLQIPVPQPCLFHSDRHPDRRGRYRPGPTKSMHKCRCFDTACPFQIDDLIQGTNKGGYRLRAFLNAHSEISLSSFRSRTSSERQAKMDGQTAQCPSSDHAFILQIDRLIQKTGKDGHGLANSIIKCLSLILPLLSDRRAHPRSRQRRGRANSVPRIPFAGQNPRGRRRGNARPQC